MALGISIIAITLIGLIYGIKKKSNVLIVSSVITLMVIAIIWIVYSYLYSLTPY